MVEAIRQLRYRPEDEAEADHLALDYMVAAGYNPRQMERLVAMLAKPDGATMAQWHRMHPNPGDRAGRIRDIIERKYERRGGRIADVEYRREVLDRLKPS